MLNLRRVSHSHTLSRVLSPLSLIRFPTFSVRPSSLSSPRFNAKATWTTRSFMRTVPLLSSHSENEKKPDQFISLTFVDLKGNRRSVSAKVGENVLDTANRYDIPIPGLCNGGGAPVEVFGEGAGCEFCHVYIQNEYTKFIKKPDWMEKLRLAVIDRARPTSRLCCQIRVTPEMDGMIVGIPEYPLSD